MSKKKRYDPLDETLKIGATSAAGVFAVGMPGMMSRQMPGTCGTAANIAKSAGRPIGLLPTIQGTGSVFGGLRELERTVKKRR